MALTEEERKSVVKLIESVPVMFQRGYLEGRRYQQELAVNWLIEQTDGSYTEMYNLMECKVLRIPISDWEAFKNLNIE